MLPVMVCVDGFILTHGMETIDMPGQEEVDKFLPQYNPPYKLDVDDPMSFGLLGDPSVYAETRYAIHKTMEEVIDLVPQVGKEYKDLFSRDSLKLIESYKLEDADLAIVAMGSVCGTIKDVVDAEREKGKKVGLLKIVTYRPFPKDAIKAAVNKIPCLAVVDKDISLGSDGALYSEIKSLLNSDKKVSGFVAGLGGRDITVDTIKGIIASAEKKTNSCTFVDLNKALLWDEFKAS